MPHPPVSPARAAQVSPDRDSDPGAQRGAVKPQVGLVVLAVFLVYLGQMALNPIIAPLAREVGLAEWQVGVMISSAALCIVLSSQFWGRLSQSWGRKPVLVTALATATGAMVIFAVLARLGMEGVLGGTLLFALFVAARGVLFGLAMAAVPPTAQAYVADVTTTETARVKGMAGIGAAQGLAMIGGAAAGGLLAGLGLMVPLLFVPAVLFVGLLAVAFFLRRESRHELVAKPVRVSPFDTRVWPFLLAGFGMFTALGFVQVITGFIIQDRFGFDGPTTAIVTGASLFAAGVGMVIAQTVIVPRSGWHPRTLLRIGAIVAFAGFALLIPVWGVPAVIVSMLFVGLGLGIAMPGYTAGPTLLISHEEQGGLAGLIGANNALTFVLAPTAATALYSWWAPAPIIASTVIMAAVALLLFLHPRFRR